MGRPRGSKNKRPELQLKMLRVANRYKIMPLDYFLSILNDKTNDEADRFEAAKHAAPYVHPRMTLELAELMRPRDGDLKTIEEVKGRLLEHGIDPEITLPRLISSGKGS